MHSALLNVGGTWSAGLAVAAVLICACSEPVATPASDASASERRDAAAAGEVDSGGSQSTDAATDAGPSAGSDAALPPADGGEVGGDGGGLDAGACALVAACTPGDGCCPAGCDVVADCDCSPEGVRIVGVSASSNDGNLPANVLDDDFATRWSANEDGAAIALELSCPAVVDSLRVATWLGDQRRAFFDVETSVDGAAWTSALAAVQSSGQSAAFESFPFAARTARFVRLVGHGNSVNAWNSFAELRIGAFPVEVRCVPNANACGPDGCGGSHPSCAGTDVCVQGACVPSNVFDVVFHADMDQATPGPYLENEWRAEWNDPAWASKANGYGTIGTEGAERYLSESFPIGSFTASTSGAQWPTKLGVTVDELYLTYWIRFSQGFARATGSGAAEPYLSGKIPGLCGGTCNTGGVQPDGTDGWSARFMFRGNPGGRERVQIFGYLYYPSCTTGWGCGLDLPQANELETGRWYQLTERIVLNDVGASNGFVEAFLDGVFVARLANLSFRTVSTLGIDQLYFSTFLGGSGDKPVTNEAIDFDDFTVFTYAPGVNVPRGAGSQGFSAAGRVLQLPPR
ncbi:MAG: discoidin domain-containing protein [Myxococcales bacterium]